MSDSYGAEGDKFGRVTASKIAELLGTQIKNPDRNEAELNNRFITIKCARVDTTSIGVTEGALGRVDYVYGAFENENATFDIFSLPAVTFQNNSRPSASDSKTRLLARSFIKSHGILIRKEVEIPKLPLEKILDRLQVMVGNHPIAFLQDLRKVLRNLKRRPSRRVFSSMHVSDKGDWAFHSGGQDELQFNLGIEQFGTQLMLRHGLAFSIEPSRTFPGDSILTALTTKVRHFNEYLALHPEGYSDFRMWHYFKKKRSHDYPVGQIHSERVALDNFIVLGKLQDFSNPDLELVLQDFDRLLALYKYVESRGQIAIPQSSTKLTPKSFDFKPGCIDKTNLATATTVQQTIDLDLRHNRLQRNLYDSLVAKYGEMNVGTEQITGDGISVDVVLKMPDNTFWFYEIKTASTARACIRQAIGQLLEYAYWPGNCPASRLIIAGEPILDPAGSKYMNKLEKEFKIPIEYKQLPPLKGNA